MGKVALTKLIKGLILLLLFFFFKSQVVRVGSKSGVLQIYNSYNSKTVFLYVSF